MTILKTHLSDAEYRLFGEYYEISAILTSGNMRERSGSRQEWQEE